MAYLTYRGTLFDSVLATASVVARLDAGDGGATSKLVLTDNGAGYRLIYSLSAGALASLSGQTAYPPTLPQTFSVILDGHSVTLGEDDIAAATAMSEADSQTIYADRSGQQTDRIEALAVDGGALTYVYLAESNGAGISAYRLKADDTLAPISEHDDSAATYADGITSMASVVVGSETYLVAASARENGVTSYRVAADGSLQLVEAMGAAELLPVGSPQALESVQMDGVSYVILASSVTSSLTVLEVGPGGTLTAVDQVMDDLSTRFANVSVLESFTHDGRVYILAAGSDDGLSLFTLLPDGRLLHLESIADTQQTSLANVTDIAVQVVDGEVQVFVISGAEAGMTQFTLNPGPAGALVSGAESDTSGSAQNDILGGGSSGVRLSGGLGDDILIDGTGQDTLVGGAGADLFVFTADGQVDTVLDFQVGVDRLDLSAYGLIHDVSALQITETSNGATLVFNDEVIVLQSQDGSPITAQDLTTADVVNITRVPLSFPVSPEDPVIEGSGADDHVVGGSTSQALYGRGGDDILTGGDGADLLDGSVGLDIADYSDAPGGVTASLSDPSLNTGFAAGDSYVGIEGLSGTDLNDTLCGDAYDNLLIGGLGDDLLCGLDGDDQIEGGDGRDRLEGGAGNDLLQAGAGNDEVLGHDGDDFLDGGAGNDNISASTGNDTIYGGDGHDQLGGGDGNDTIYGGAGNDTIGSGNDDDFIDAGDGNDVTSGGYGADLEYGGTGDDTMAGSYGNDIVHGGAGNDSLGGGTGKDQLFGEDGDDEIGCGSFDDQAWGGNGNDFIGGGDGNDQLYGEAGVDKLNGGQGDDAFWGGSEADIFVFNEFVSGETDTIHDFENGLDVVRLKGVAGGYAALEIGEITIGTETYVQLEYADHTIRLGGVDIADVDASDFLFI